MGSSSNLAGTSPSKRKPGAGTAFHLYLPRCHEVQQVMDTDVAAPRLPPTGHETVLVVEDNAEVLELAVTTISDLGYRVLTARDGPTALKVVRSKEPIDLLFSDVVMPGGINGFELIRQARGIRNGLKAIVTSGYANVHRPGTDRPDVPLLLKPYRRSDLAQCIRTALDGSDGSPTRPRHKPKFTDHNSFVALSSWPGVSRPSAYIGTIVPAETDGRLGGRP